MSDELISAIRENNINQVRELVAAGVNVNQENHNGDISLIKAIFKGNIDIIKLLIEAEANVNQENKNGDTPLRQAISGNKIDIINLLIEAGANVDQEDENADTPLIKAIFKGDIDIIKLLIEAGANVNQENDNGQTPLIKAIILYISEKERPIYKNLINIIKLFINKGSNVNIRDNYKRTPYSYSRCNSEISEILKDAGAIVEDFKENKILYLTHVTTLETLKHILKSNKLYSDFDMMYRNPNKTFYNIEEESTQYPGLYTTLITSDLVGTPIRWYIVHDADICLVFCKTLLDREDFHWNSDDISGRMFENISSFKIDEIKDNIKEKCTDVKNEVVFHHSVSLKYLKEIWVKNEKIYNKVKKILKNIYMNIPVQITNSYLDESIICDEPVKKLKTNNCWYPDIKNNIEFVKKLAKECGLTDIDDPKIIQELLTKQILPTDITIEGIKEYLKSEGVSDDTIENLSESQLENLRRINLVGLNFFKNYSRFDGGKGRKKSGGSKRRKSNRKKSGGSKRIKSNRKKSGSKRRKSNRKKLGSKRIKSNRKYKSAGRKKYVCRK